MLSVWPAQTSLLCHYILRKLAHSLTHSRSHSTPFFCYSLQHYQGRLTLDTFSHSTNSKHREQYIQQMKKKRKKKSHLHSAMTDTPLAVKPRSNLKSVSKGTQPCFLTLQLLLSLDLIDTPLSRTSHIRNNWTNDCCRSVTRIHTRVRTPSRSRREPRFLREHTLGLDKIANACSRAQPRLVFTLDFSPVHRSTWTWGDQPLCLDYEWT